MQKVIAILLLSVTSAMAQTNVATLSDTEKELHRWGFCLAIQRSLEIEDERRFNDIPELHRLLYENGAASTQNDPHDVFEKSMADGNFKLHTGKIEVSNAMIESCENDMRSILAHNYVPHFKYVAN